MRSIDLRTLGLVSAGLALSLSTACLPGSVARELREVLPDDRVLVQFPTRSAFVKDAADGEWSQAWHFTAEVTEDVNGLIGFVLVMVDQLTQLPPSSVAPDGTQATWGPWSDALDPVETALHVTYDPDLDTYTWSFVQKPKGDDDSAYVAVIAGEVDAGSSREAYSGRFAIDFTTLHDLNPTSEAQGVFVSEYDVQPEGVVASAGFEGFTDGGAPIDALYAYQQVPGGEGSMDLAWLTDSLGGPLEELHSVHSRWTSEGAGRADALLTGGEIGEGSETLSECWSGDFDAVYRVESWSGLEEGDPALCAFDVAEYSGPE